MDRELGGVGDWLLILLISYNSKCFAAGVICRCDLHPAGFVLDLGEKVP